MTEYIAFLRGINVGGHKIIKMTRLAAIFESMGFAGVKTYIQSGNVWFTSPETSEQKLVVLIGKSLRSELEYDVNIILRTTGYLRAIAGNSIFTGKLQAKEEKFYVTFYPEPVKTDLTFPVISPKKDYIILHAENREVYSVSIHLPGGNYGNAGIMVEKMFGSNGTTRNWNTVLKMV